MKTRTNSRRDLALAGAAALIGAAPFLLTAPFCGLYLDDFSFLLLLQDASPRELWLAFLRYVPGRNLHIPFFYGLLKLTAGSVAAMHLIGVAFDALNAALLFLLVRRLTGLRSVALASAAIFALAPNHGETHFWITLIPQIQIPAALTLTALLLAAGGALLPACAAYAAALFTYDQVFFLWPLLLAVAWARDAAPRRGRYAAAAAALLALNVAHLALRYLSPYASGGRPLIRAAEFLHRCRDAAAAVRAGVLPWPTSSHAHWAWTLPLLALALAAAVWLTRSVRAEARDEAGELSAWTRGDGALAAAAGGAVWTFLAYLPNLFWYLSPRHNLLPSIGWALTLASAGAYAASRGRRAAAALPWLAGIFFAAAAVSGVHEGTQWIDSRLLRDGFISAVRGLTPPVDSVFLAGAPRSLRRAPAFNLPHDVVMAAGVALKRPALDQGDYQVAPTRRGVVYRNDLTLLPESDFRWMPAEEVNLLSYDAGDRSFTCVSGLRVARPDGTEQSLALRPGCALELPMTADAALISSAEGPPRARGNAPRVGGLALLGAAVAFRDETTFLVLDWLVETAPRATLAFIPKIKDASGAVLLDAVFPSRGMKRPYPMIWPLVDDLAAGLDLKPGRTLRETFVLRRVFKAAPGAVLELDVFELPPPGSSVRLGTASVELIQSSK